ncbi:VanZ family protein [Streptomyces sp. H27-D2]|nr:VanZ family protein [Streptomyces sp. H27-D2]MEC4018360.1 VanZ family protein [Streptomyces sp. H27-D2]
MWARRGGRTKTGPPESREPPATRKPSGAPGASDAPGASGASDSADATNPADWADSWRNAARASWPVRALLLLLAFAAMVGFAVVLARLTLLPSASSVSLTHSNLHPGDSIRDYLGQPALRDTVKQLGGNILLGVPFGVLLPVLVPKARGLLRVGIATAMVMLLVELVQGALITGRAFDIDDVILNTTGALLGYLLLGRRLGRAVHPRRLHWWQRSRARAAARPPAGNPAGKA